MNNQIKKIVFAFDFSEAAKSALKVAIAIAQRQDAELFLTHIVEGGLGATQSKMQITEQKDEMKKNFLI